jgi:hypothetical protein
MPAQRALQAEALSNDQGAQPSADYLARHFQIEL